ncbi:MAG TPA: ATP-binding protein [Candidatus Limnocylindria bacterium]|nr:ATP-binding protein [Candidatus Limnocylindria bacterium]
MSIVLDRESQSPAPFAGVRVEDDAAGWSLSAPSALDAARMRQTFRCYLERHGHPASDFHAAESAFGELVANCTRHAPGPLRIVFRWEDAALTVIDASDRLRSWPFSPDDVAAETTHHGFALLSALTARVHVSRDPAGGTRAQVVLPVLRSLR